MEYFTKDSDGNYQKVTDKLHNQADVDGIIDTRIKREREKYKDYDDLKTKAAKVDSIASEFETKLKTVGEEKSAIEKERDSAKLETVKVKTMHEFKLSEGLSEFINGTDEDTIRNQAEKLKNGLPGESVVVNKDPKPPEGEAKAGTAAKVAGDLFGRTDTD